MPNEVVVVIKTVVDNNAVKNSARGIAEALKPVGAAIAGSGLLSMAAPLGAAGLAMGAFAAVAKPTLDKVEKALTTTGKAGKKAWDQLDPAQTAIARNIQGLQRSFDGIAKAAEPLVVSVTGLALTVARDLLPALGPLAKAGGSVITDFLKPLDVLLRSSSFSTFVKTMSQFATQVGPVLGTFFAQLVKILMNLFVQVMPAGMQILKVLLPALSTMLTQSVPVVAALAGMFANTVKWLNQNKILIPVLWGVVAALAAMKLGMLANPVGLVVTGLALLAIAFETLWKKSALFRDILKDLAKVMLGVGIVILQVNKGIIDSFLSVIGTMLHVLATTLGWVPGIGGALKSASKHFDDFKSGADNAINGMIAKMQGWQRELSAARDTSSQASAAIISHFKGQGAAARQGRVDLDAYTTAVQNNSTKSDAVKAARLRLIKDLENAGLSAHDATKLVDNLGTSVRNLPAGKTLRLAVDANGNVTITGSDGKKYQISAGGYYSPHAAGGIINDGVPYAGAQGDDVLISAKRGEAIVPVNKVPALAPALGAAGIPGFAAGGIVGFGGQFQGKFTDLVADAFGKAGQVAVSAAVNAAKAAASSSVSGAGPAGGDPATNAALAKKLHPDWASGNNWAMWNYIAMAESGWNRFARNPNGGAYGIPQALPPTKMPFAAQAAGGSHAAPQINWMYDYINSGHTYGRGLAAAYNNERINHWYDNGGWLQPGVTIAHNNTGAPERVLGPHDTITLEVVGGSSEFEAFFANMIKRYVRIKGGGKVQKAFGIGA